MSLGLGGRASQGATRLLLHTESWSGPEARGPGALRQPDPLPASQWRVSHTPARLHREPSGLGSPERRSQAIPVACADRPRVEACGQPAGRAWTSWLCCSERWDLAKAGQLLSLSVPIRRVGVMLASASAVPGLMIPPRPGSCFHHSPDTCQGGQRAPSVLACRP